MFVDYDAESLRCSECPGDTVYLPAGAARWVTNLEDGRFAFHEEGPSEVFNEIRDVVRAFHVQHLECGK